MSKKRDNKSKKSGRNKSSATNRPVNSINMMMRTAVEHHQSGRLDQAWEMYRQVLEKTPAQQDALHLAGLIAQSRGDLPLAADLIRQAIISSPETMFFYNSLSSVLMGLELYSEAEKTLNKIIAYNPEDISAVRNLGMLLMHSDRMDEAERCYLKIFRDFPDDFDASNNLGVICRRTGRIKEAIEFFGEAVKQRPDSAEARNNMGSCYADDGERKEAAACFEMAIQLNSDYAEAYNNLGVICRENGEEEKAISLFRKVINLRPDYYEAYDNLGAVLIGLDRAAEALNYINKALEINPICVDAQCNRAIALMQLEDLEAAETGSLMVLNLDSGKKEALNNLGLVYMKMGKLDDAARYYNNAIDIDSQYEDAILNLANVLTWQGKLNEAFECFDKVLALKNNNATVHYNHSYALLLSGNLAQGWLEHEWRFKTKHNAVTRYGDIARWQGESLKDKTLLVYAEQGIGDEIRFANCIPDVIKQARHVVIECDPRLQGLYQRSFPEASVYGVKRDNHEWLSTAPPIDLQIAVGSLPTYTRTRLEDFPQAGHYLTADPERVQYWKERLKDLDSGPRVGIAWRGGLRTAERDLHYPNFKKDLAAILQVPSVQFINMMYDECSEEREWVRRELGVEIHDFSELDQLNDMEGVAALMSSLDLMISVPLSVSEMAGALAVPTWYMIFTHHVNTLGTDHLPWFPRSRCFFKGRGKEWMPVIETLAQELSELT